MSPFQTIYRYLNPSRGKVERIIYLRDFLWTSSYCTNTSLSTPPFVCRVEQGNTTYRNTLIPLQRVRLRTSDTGDEHSVWQSRGTFLTRILSKWTFLNHRDTRILLIFTHKLFIKRFRFQYLSFLYLYVNVRHISTWTYGTKYLRFWVEKM